MICVNKKVCFLLFIAFTPNQNLHAMWRRAKKQDAETQTVTRKPLLKRPSTWLAGTGACLLGGWYIWYQCKNAPANSAFPRALNWLKRHMGAQEAQENGESQDQGFRIKITNKVPLTAYQKRVDLPHRYDSLLLSENFAEYHIEELNVPKSWTPAFIAQHINRTAQNKQPHVMIYIERIGAQEQPEQELQAHYINMIITIENDGAITCCWSEEGENFYLQKTGQSTPSPLNNVEASQYAAAIERLSKNQ